jgi:hypothetical protein
VGDQIRRQETECVEAIEEALHQSPQRGLEQNPLMNTQAFPLEFLEKFFPALARAKATSVGSATTEGASIQTGGVFLSAAPRSINEPGIVEIILRVRVDGPRSGFLDTHKPRSQADRGDNCHEPQKVEEAEIA